MYDKPDSPPKPKFRNLTDTGSWELETAGGGKHYLRWRGIWAGKSRNWRVAQLTIGGQLYSMMYIKDDSAGIRRQMLQDFQTKPELQFARDRLKRFLDEICDLNNPAARPNW